MKGSLVSEGWDDMLLVQVNGEPYEMEEAATVLDVIERMKLRAGYVAVEVNAQLVPREAHGQRRLESGDEIEVVTLVGGG
jgi:sulfur carrier protein